MCTRGAYAGQPMCTSGANTRQKICTRGAYVGQQMCTCGAHTQGSRCAHAGQTPGILGCSQWCDDDAAGGSSKQNVPDTCRIDT
eukprot:8635869-Pyramimonas_sp.AAC.1